MTDTFKCNICKKEKCCIWNKVIDGKTGEEIKGIRMYSQPINWNGTNVCINCFNENFPSIGTEPVELKDY